MPNISDIIERFILEQMQEENVLNLSRNELASFFNCAPSQINYVLSTRFTNPRGFIVESRRGGGGYVKVIRLSSENGDYIQTLISEMLSDEIDFTTAKQICDNLLDRGIINKGECDVIISAISNNALNNPIKLEDKLRANILRNILINIIKEEE